MEDMPCRRRSSRTLGAVASLALTLATFWVGGPDRPAAAVPRQPTPPDRYYPGAPPDPGDLGIALSGIGTAMRPPTSPTRVPYTSNCHKLIDGGFTGVCVTAQGPGGEVAGIVESERGALATQERDLVWRRTGDKWSLALVHTFQPSGYLTRLWAVRLRRASPPYLVFVTPVDRPGFGRNLNVVDTAGHVSLYRYLGEGFALVPPGGGLLTYTPAATQAAPAGNYFDQVLVGWYGGHWRVLADQYVPYRAALAQHKALFRGAGAAAATASGT